MTQYERTKYERTKYFAGQIVDMINKTVGADHVLRNEIEENPTEFFLAFGVVAPHHVYKAIIDEDMEALPFTHLMNQVYKAIIDEDMEALPFTHLMNQLLVQSMLSMKAKEDEVTITFSVGDDETDGGVE
jgi:hypothetical protein